MYLDNLISQVNQLTCYFSRKWLFMLLMVFMPLLHYKLFMSL
nr:MAG TPA: hypothetical protein [Caudoviricetes sp.]